MDAVTRSRLLRAGVAVLGAAALVAGASVAAVAIPLRDEAGTRVAVTSISVDDGPRASGADGAVPPGDQPAPDGVPLPSASERPGPQPVRPVPPVELDAP